MCSYTPSEDFLCAIYHFSQSFSQNIHLLSEKKNSYEKYFTVKSDISGLSQ